MESGNCKVSFILNMGTVTEATPWSQDGVQCIPLYFAKSIGILRPSYLARFFTSIKTIHALNTIVLNHTGMQVGSLHLTESAEKLPQELVIPNDQIRLLESIGQGEL